MRAYERQSGESDTAFACYSVFRDLGPGRTLREAAAIYYDRPAYREHTRSVPAQVKKWSAKFDWPERARQRDDYVDMIRLQAVEEHEQERAADLVAREAALREQNRENEERAAAITAKYLDYAERLIDELPLVCQVTVREGEDGKPAIYQIEPATKDAVLDATRLHKIATRGEPKRVGHGRSELRLLENDRRAAPAHIRGRTPVAGAGRRLARDRRPLETLPIILLRRSSLRTRGLWYRGW